LTVTVILQSDFVLLLLKLTQLCTNFTINCNNSITDVHGRDHATPLLRQLHSLAVHQRVIFEIHQPLSMSMSIIIFDVAKIAITIA